MANEIQRRSCANCVSFNHAPKGDDPLCWNLIPISVEHASSGHCDQHLTPDEDRYQTAFIEEGRQSGGLPGAHAALQAWQHGRDFISNLGGHHGT